ncbi:hypothetical protein JHK85_000842 [Glycine max]|nr:hypothetical protein JHK85_000842 [Glycine max]KAG5088202.1 hypothetical protein JHK86_000814 [Glycine max]
MERRKQLDQYYGLARSVRIYGPNNLLVILILCNITVIENAGSYRTTRHTYKLLFHRRTTIIPSKDDSIPRNGFTMMDAEEIKNTNGLIANGLVVNILLGFIEDKNRYVPLTDDFIKLVLELVLGIRFAKVLEGTRKEGSHCFVHLCSKFVNTSQAASPVTQA